MSASRHGTAWPSLWRPDKGLARIITAAPPERAALDAAIASAEHVPCLGPDRRLWLSDDPADSLEARSLCAGCPVIEPCREYRKAIRPSAGTWAGHTCYRSEGLDDD